MNIQELLENIEFLNNPDQVISLSMYMVMKDGTIKFANLESNAREELKNKFIAHLNQRLGGFKL